ncbi:hypothetical protein NDA13_005637 [Ustilago tritici]|nr:hypothetical protein NDA13_005637 [Ustilago tritici]
MTAPSSPSLPGLPASPQKKLLYDTLKKPFDDQDSSVIIWIQMLKEATLPNVGRKTHVKRLDFFLDNEYFDQLIDGLKSIADRLLEKFVDSFLHPSGSGADSSATPASNKQRAPKTKEQEEEDAKSRLLLRHHVFISGLTPEGLPLLKQLMGPAAKQVRLLFGDADSLDMLEFNKAQANYVRCLPLEEHRRAWDEAQTRMEGRLVLLLSSLSM